MHLETRYYVCGHTAKGFVNYLDSNLADIKQIVILKHPAKCVKTKAIKQFMEQHSVEAQQIISSPYSKRYIAGVIIPSLSLAILSEEIISEDITTAKVIDLAKYSKVKTNRDLMIYLDRIVTASYEAAYRYFAKGLTYHEQLEKVYLREMNFTKADSIANEFITKLFLHQKTHNRKAIIKERLFGTNTSDGIVNHLQEIIEPIENRIFIKGRAGTGKSYFMKKVMEACVENGYDVELYHCSFDPGSIDMILIRDLNYCLFDSTAPHELFPMRTTDQIIDLYEKTVTPFTDEKYVMEINKLTTKYKQEMQQGIALLKNTKEAEEMIDRLWVEEVIEILDFTSIMS